MTSETASHPPDGATGGHGTLGTMILSGAGRHRSPALRHHDGTRWREISYAELVTLSRQIARGLIALGVLPGQPVAILSSTRVEWTLADCGAHCAGAVVVPIYHTNSPGECRHVLAHSEAEVVFCEDAGQLAKVQAIRDDLPRLRHVVTFDGAGELSMDDLRAAGEEVDPEAVDRAVAAVGPQDVATIVYTSGTTGPPKGCLTTHRNCVSTIAMYERALNLRPASPPSIYLFLPLAHSLARMTQFVALDAGGTLTFWRGDTSLVLADIAQTSPTHLPAVPRIFEKIHTTALAGVQDAGLLKTSVFRWGLGVGRSARAREQAGRPLSALQRRRLAVADRLVLSRVRGLFGSRLEAALTGAAPIAVDVLEFFDACGVPVLEGYGMTETTAAATLNTPDHRRIGTVGRPLEGTEVTTATDGELLMRGPHIFSGYLKDEQATREVLTAGGWLRSGDLGEIDADGYVRVTGRKKDLIITSSGKNISPANIESALRESRWISGALVHGDGRPYLVALITLDPAETAQLAERCGCGTDPEELAASPAVRAEIGREIEVVNAQFARIEQVKRFAILGEDFSQERGELTPTLKVKRDVVTARHRALLARLYEEE